MLTINHEETSRKSFCEIRLPSGAVISVQDGAQFPIILEGINKYGWLNPSVQTGIVMQSPIQPPARPEHSLPRPPTNEHDAPPPSVDRLDTWGATLTAVIEQSRNELLSTIKEQVIEEDCLFSEAAEAYLQSDEVKKLHHSRVGVYAFFRDSFKDIVGDKLLSELRYKDIAHYTGILKHIPAYAKQREEFKEKDFYTIAKEAQGKGLKPIKTSTQFKHIKAMRSFFHWCMQRFEMKRDVTTCVKGSDYIRDEEQSRQPFTDSELSEIFSHAFLKKLDAPWKFWAIHLAFFSGMRVNEIGQIDVEDICEVVVGVDSQGRSITVPCISINRKNGKSLKTRNSRRYLPIHSKVVALGFLDYVAHMKSLGFKHVFPDLHERAGTPGSKISAWFNSTHLKSWCEIDDSQKKFHSFRNHFWTFGELSVEVPESALRKLTGTGRGRSVERVHYIKEADVKSCKEALEKIAFPTVDFLPYDPEQFANYFREQVKYASPDDLVTSLRKGPGRPPGKGRSFEPNDDISQKTGVCSAQKSVPVDSHVT